MKVYIAERGVYESTGISGVYATLEAAMQAYPVPTRPLRRDHATHEREGGWQPDGYGGWNNGLDWDDHTTIHEYEVNE